MRFAHAVATLTAAAALVCANSEAVGVASTDTTTASATGTAGARSGSLSSDFVALYHALYQQQEQQTVSSRLTTESNVSRLDPVAFKQSVPSEVKSRLDPYSLVFSDLPELLKRALLWESGYSIGDDASLAQIHTLCGLSMADIALSETEFAASACKADKCTPAADASATKSETDAADAWSYSTACRADQLLPVAKCASTAVDAVSSVQLWSSKPLLHEHSANTSALAVPNVYVRRHQSGSEADPAQPAHVYAIHAKVPNAGASSCSLTDPLAAIVIPCVPFQRSDSRWCRPARSEVMTTWLEEYFAKHGASTPATNTSLQELDVENSTLAAAAEHVKDEHGVYVRAAFQYDGSSSDIVQQLYRRHLAGDSDNGAVSKLFLDAPLPAEVEQRLVDASLQFDDLPALLQRALLWDSGFVVGSTSSAASEDTPTPLTPVLVRCGLGMGDIAVSVESVEQVKDSCTMQNCSTASANADGNSTTQSSRRLLGCADDRLASKSLCAVAASVSNASANSSSPSMPMLSMWGDGGLDVAVPEVSIKRRAWESHGKFYEMFAIHTDRAAGGGGGGGAPSEDSCPKKPSMVIPCVSYASTASSGSGDASRTQAWCRPRPGVLVSSWMRQVAKQKSFSLLYLLPILVSVALALTGLALYIRRKTFKRFDHKSDDSGRMFANTIASTPGGLYATNSLSLSQCNSVVVGDTRLSALSSRSSIESFAAFSSNHVLHTLVNHPSLRLHTVPFDQIQFLSLLSSKDARAETWLASMRNTQVVVKRLTRARKAEYDELEGFMGEITLNATLDHPNIAKFVGVAWTTLQNLCMVTEYVENGDLQLYLTQHCLQLAWEKAKLHIAIGVATAICYLHDRQPRVLQGGIDSKHVLLTTELDAKLIGVSAANRSRPRRYSTVSDDVESAPFWTAPEVLAGEPSSEKSDVYSLGILLSELDTHQTPYEGLMRMTTGADLQPLEILQHVAAGAMKPTTSPFCPLEIVELIDACLDLDPQRRPSASEVVATLEKMPVATVGANTYSF